MGRRADGRQYIDRRLFLGSLAVGGLGSMAGCLEDVVGDVTSFSAAPAIVSSAVADDAGYEYQGTERQVDTETVAGTPIEITSYVSIYVRTIDVPFIDAEVDAGLFGLLTTPQVSVAGREFNPLEDSSHAEIVDHARQQYGDLSIDDAVDSRTVTALDDDIDIERFKGTVSIEDQDGIDVFLDVSQSDHDGDHLVIVGATPDDDRLDRDAETERIDTMIGGIDHGEHVDVPID